MASWKKIVALDSSPTVNNSFITVDTDNDVNVVAFGGLTPVPLSTYGSVAERLTEQASDFNFAVHDSSAESGGSHRRVTFDDIAGALTVDIVNTLVDSGQGSVSTYTGSTSGNLGDLNDDGTVGTADLLMLLTAFGQVGDPIYGDSGVVLSNCPSVSPSNGGGGTLFFGDDASSGQLDQIPLSNANFNQGGAISLSVDENTDIITASAPSGIDISAFVNQSIAIRSNNTEFHVVSTIGGGAAESPYGIWAKVKTLDSSDTEIETVWVSLGIFGTSEPGTVDSVYLNEDIHIGGPSNSQGVDLGDLDVASIEVSFFVDDFFDCLSSIEIESLDVDFLVNG